MSAQHSLPSSARKEILADALVRTHLAVSARRDATCDAERCDFDCDADLCQEVVCFGTGLRVTCTFLAE